jgi:sporulation protein YlmC with PRC-barrel domain
MSREINLELLLGRKVRDAEGMPVGHIEEIVAERRGGECVVREYLLGRAALLGRLSVKAEGLMNLRLFGKPSHGGYRVPWDKMDLSEEERPRLTCVKDELERL